ncbi:hypothetical protein Avbf_14931, partial [Armadillidium vulgare]
MLEVIGLLTFLLPTCSYGDRALSILDILLTMATLFSQLIGNIPKSAEPKLLDIWMFAHVLVLAQIYFGHMVVIYLDNLETKAEIGRKLVKGKIIKDNDSEASQTKE